MQLLWFQIKLALIALIFVNGFTMGRTAAQKIQALIEGGAPVSDDDATIAHAQNRVRLFLITQLVLFSAIVVLSVFRFT